MHKEGSRAAGKDIVIKDVGAGAFRTLLRFLYVHTLPEEEDCGEGLAVGEMARVAGWFQESELYAQCVEHFREGLAVGNVAARLVQAHNSGLAGLEEAVMEYFKANALAFKVCCKQSDFCCFREISVVRYHQAERVIYDILVWRVEKESIATLDVPEQRPDLLPLTLLITKSLVQAAVAAAAVQATHTAYAAGVAARAVPSYQRRPSVLE